MIKIDDPYKIPDAHPVDVYNMLRRLTTDPHYTRTEEDASNQLIEWYQAAYEMESSVRRFGVLNFISTYQSPRVWATLLRFKNDGVEGLPL